MLAPVLITVPPVVLPGSSDPVEAEGSTSVIPLPNRSPVKGRAAPVPSTTLRLSPVVLVGICILAASKASRMATSKAPLTPLPVFSTTMQNFTRSLPSTFERLESIGWLARPEDVIVPVKAAPGWPGCENVTPAGATVGGVNTPAVLVVETTPLVMSRSGKEICTWASAVLLVSRLPVSFRSSCSAWFVSRRPSANGRLVAVTVNRMSVTAERSWLSWNVPKIQVTLLAAALKVSVGVRPEIVVNVSVGPKLHCPAAGAVADGPPPANARLCAAKIGSGRKSVIR